MAAGLGALIVPQSLARLHHRRDLTYQSDRRRADGSCRACLPEGPQSELLEDFIRVVQGRKPGSSRGPAEPPPKRTAGRRLSPSRPPRAAAGRPQVSQAGPGGDPMTEIRARCQLCMQQNVEPTT